MKKKIAPRAVSQNRNLDNNRPALSFADKLYDSEKRTTDGRDLLLRTIKSASRSTSWLNGGWGHMVTLAAVHLGVWSIIDDNIQSRCAYDAWSYAYGQRTSLREPIAVAGHSISLLWWSTVTLGSQSTFPGKHTLLEFTSSQQFSTWQCMDLWYH